MRAGGGEAGDDADGDAGKSGITNEPATPRTPPSAPQMTGSHLLSSFVALTACAASAQITVTAATDVMP